jgi:P27 family predicted phage terminase small subunit
MGKRGPKTRALRTAKRPRLTDGWAPPGHLTDEAADAWRHLVGLLRAAGNLARTDPAVVEVYAINVALLREAQAAVTADGIVLQRAGTPVAHPAAAVLNAASMRIKAIAAELGLTPASSKFAADRGEAKQTGWDGLVGLVGTVG